MIVDTEKRFQFYGRRKGKSLRRHHSELMDQLLPHLRVALHDPLSGMGERRWLEIGFGGGEHLAHQAELHPDVSFIGAEPFVNGVAKMLALVEEKNLANVKLHDGDARPLLEALPEASFERIYLLYPDPWPKARHAKRRMMNDGPVDMFAAKVRPGGIFRFGTDHPVYLRHALMVMQRHADQFEWLCDKPADFQNRPGGWPETRYEAKARAEGHEVWYFRYRRR